MQWTEAAEALRKGNLPRLVVSPFDQTYPRPALQPLLHVFLASLTTPTTSRGALTARKTRSVDSREGRSLHIHAHKA